MNYFQPYLGSVLICNLNVVQEGELVVIGDHFKICRSNLGRQLH